MERRIVTSEFEVRAAGGVTTIEGHAAVFNRFSQNLGGFVEQVAPGAFAKTIQEADVRALLNHDPNLVLGRNKAGTLDLSEDSLGLAYRVRLGDQSYARDLAISMERGDITQSSFGFQVMPNGDDWGLTPQEFPLRTLTEVSLFDVSPVTYPAYLDADSGIADRALARLAEARSLTADKVSAATLRAIITGTYRDADTDDDDDPGKIAQAVDAAIDEALDLFESEPAQALALMQAADLAVDKLLAVLGVEDPDEVGRSRKPAAATSDFTDWARRNALTGRLVALGARLF